MADIEAREEAPIPDRWTRWFEEMPRWFPDVWRSRLDAEAIRVEEVREGDDLVVRAEMPGIDPDRDVEIEVRDHDLRLRAERREEHTTEDAGQKRSEFRYGSFSRTVPLPVGATDQDVHATYKDGILEVRIPIDQGRGRPRRIPVQRA
jgi:HSP20 family protein